MKNFWIIIGVLIVGFGIYFVTSTPPSVEETNVQQESGQVNNNEQEETQNEDIQQSPENDLASGSYEEYSSNKLLENSDKDIILFFKADWCPSCRALDSNTKSNLDEIPDNVVILDVDYDQYTELKQKYGVTTQHTLVQVDAQGNLINKWSGGNRLSSVLDQIQ